MAQEDLDDYLGENEHTHLFENSMIMTDEILSDPDVSTADVGTQTIFGKEAAKYTVTLYPVWTKNSVTITLDGAGAEFLDDQNVSDSNILKRAIQLKGGQISIPVNTAEEFKNDNNDDGTMDAAAAVFDPRAFIPHLSSKIADGWILDGWYFVNDEGNEERVTSANLMKTNVLYDADSHADGLRDMTYFAKWVQIPYYIIYEDDSAKYVMTDALKEQGTSLGTSWTATLKADNQHAYETATPAYYTENMTAGGKVSLMKELFAGQHASATFKGWSINGVPAV